MKHKILVRYHSMIFIAVFLSYDILVKLYANIPITAVKSVAFTISYASGCLLISYLFNKRYIIKVQLLFIVAAFSLAATNVIHFRFFNTFFTFTSLQAAGEFKDFSNEVLYVLNPVYLFLLVPMIGFIFYTRKVEIVEYTKKHVLLTYSIVMILSYSAPFAFFDEHESLSNDEYYLYDHLQNRVLSVQRFGLFAYTRQDISNTLFAAKRNTTTIEDIDAFFETERKSYEDNLYTGMFEGKNLILIQAESLNAQAISKELTPTLYRLKNEGMYFDNFYAPLYNGSTSDTEFVTLTGLLPSLDYGTTFINFADNDFSSSLPNTFRQAGYSVDSYHANHRSFYNRENMHPALGFDLHDTESLGIEQLTSDTQLMEAYLKQMPSDQFVSLLITVTGHSPYVDRPDITKYYNQLLNDPAYKDLDESIIAYYATQMELDHSLQVLLEGLKAKGVLDDTVIVIYGDHQPKLDINVFQDTLGKEAANQYELSKVPLIIYNKGIEPKRYDDLMASVDLWPTLSNLFGYQEQNAYLFGSDFFSLNTSIVLFQNRAYLIEGCLETSEKIADFCEITDEAKNKVDRFVSKAVDIWQAILLHDYFGGK